MPLRSTSLMAGFFALGALVTWLSADPRRAATLRRLELPAALAVAWLSYVWCDHALAPADRSSEPFMLVINCLLFGLCFTAGTGSSVVLDNGAVWPDLMLAVRHFGGTMSTVRVAVFALAAAGIGLIFLAAARFTRPALATPAAVLSLALMTAIRFGIPLLDCSITLLFAAAAAAFLLVFALTGDLLPLAAAAVFTSHAVNAHPSAAILLPPLVLLAALGGRRWYVSTPLAVAVFVAAGAATSSQALLGNWQAISAAGLRTWVYVGSLVVVAVGAALNPAFRDLPARARAALAAAALVGPYAAGVGVLVAIHHEVHARYFPPVLAPAVIVAVLLLAWPARRFAPARFRHRAVFLVPMAFALAALRLGPNPDTPPRAAQLARTDAIELPPVEAQQLTLEGREGLRRLAERAHRGDLGGPVEGAGFRPSFQGFSHDGAIRIDLARRDGSAVGFMLMRPPVARGATSPRHFVLYPDDDVAPAEARRLAAVLDEVFPESPWAGDPRAFPPRLHMPGPAGEPVGPGRAWLSVWLVVASTLAGLGLFVATARPRSPDESLVPAD
ncbi:MAG: hypothetical protein JWM10_1281 [Myxococcaceae bacterium]|nr:hypothetical protein [Myxococcaceae bacterium]